MSAPKIQILPLRNPRLTNPKPKVSKPASGSSTSGDEPVKEKKSRAGKPKVRTGCLTCKIRRIKCDEGKPACNKCTSTGRKCDGYMPRISKQDRIRDVISTAVKPQPGLQLIRGDGAELQAIDFFHHRTVRALASYFDNDFWGKLVFQMCHSESPVRHATVALGILHRRRDILPTPRPYHHMNILFAFHTPNLAWRATSVGEADEPFALSQYTKAVSSLARRIGTNTWTPEMTLMVCILFICIEFLRGDSVQAFRHFDGGMQIAVAMLKKYETSGSIETAPNLEFLRGNLMPFFNRLELLSSHWGHAATWEYPIKPNNIVPKRFETIRQARDSVVHIMNLVMRFVRTTYLARFTGAVTEEHRSHQRDLHAKLRTWWILLESLLSSSSFNEHQLTAVNILRLHAQIASIWLSMALENNESSTDALEVQWLHIVEWAESVVDARIQHDLPNFAFDMELVSPMYFVIIVCRFPPIRRRALAIQRGILRREGLWDSNVAAIIGQRFMEIEERNLQVFDGSQLPAEEDRIYNSEIDSDAAMNPQNHTVTFYHRVPGQLNAWRVWKEKFFLQPAPSDVRTAVRSSPSWIQYSIVPSSKVHAHPDPFSQQFKTLTHPFSENNHQAAENSDKRSQFPL